MHALSKLFQRTSFRSKLVLSYLLVVFIPILVVGIYIYGNTISLNSSSWLAVAILRRCMACT